MFNKSVRVFVSVLSVAFLFTGVAAWADSAPPCMANGQDLTVNNDQVLQWKSTTRNQYQARAHIQGQLIRLYSTHDRDHYHMEVQIGQQPTTDTVEVVYNQAFGRLPNLKAGDAIEACGDYKTSNKQSGYYAPSPDGAIVHWIHHSTNPHHESGFLMINGVLFGQR